MEPSSSTSSSRTWLTPVVWAVVVVGVWVAYALLAGPVSSWVGGRFEAQILALGKGRIVDAVSFVAHRGRDAALLFTAAVVLGNAALIVHRWILSRIDRLWAPLPISLVWFAALNVLLAVAGKTALWWMALHAAHPNLQLTAFHIERILLEEGGAPTNVVVLGSSQGQSEISSGELTGYGLPEVQAANLSYAGAAAADLPLMREHYRRIDPDVLVLYMSPINVFAEISGSRWTPLLTFGSLREMLGTQAMTLGELAPKLQGVVGLAIPMVRQSRALQHAFFGLISEQGYLRPGFGGSLEEEGDKYAPVDEPVELQSEFLLRFLEEEAEAGRKILVIDGAVSPLLTESFDPDVIPQYNAVMAAVRSLHPNITVVADELPSHPMSDYLDLYHIRPEVRTVFTRELAAVMADKLGLPMNTATP